MADGRYISGSRQSATILSAALAGTEPHEDLNALTRQQEELVGPVMLYANDEVRKALEDVSDAFHDAQRRSSLSMKGA